MTLKYNHLFGPVPSRRLGMSLGVDLMPAKTCNLDCIYCECGTTTQKTNDRHEYLSPSEIIAELKDFLSPSPSLDVVTITGSGEPTLNTALGAVISYLKTVFPAYKTALLTNGTLLYRDDVRDAALQFDYVLPSLDAASDRIFASVNRPADGLETGTIIRGIADFARAYKGILWLEIFIVPGINDSSSELSLLKEAARTIKPARVQLNTLDRPGALDSVVPASDKRLAEIASFFNPLPVEIISRQFVPCAGAQATADLKSGVLSLLRRRPSTVEDLAVASQHNINDILSLLSQLTKNKAVMSETVNNRLFYKSLQEKTVP
jgi:wyosine [tRNA(Phe)-imidazoG37] synthetase (radical SAM superfamily)